MSEATEEKTAIGSKYRRPALIVTLAFILFVGVLAGLATCVADNVWQRLLTLFYSVEAIGFAAAGLLFGTTIEAPSRHAMKAMAESNQTFERTVVEVKGTAEAAAKDLEVVSETLQALPAESTKDPKLQDAIKMVSKVKGQLGEVTK